MKQTVIISILIFVYFTSFAQFTTMFTDTIHNYGQMNGVCQDDSFYYVIGGINNSVLKIDKQGNIVKKRKYSYPGLYFQAFPYNSVVLENNTIVSCGQAKDTSNKVTGIVVCVDKYSLDTLWFRNYQSPDSVGVYQFSENTAIKSVPQGGYIVTGNYHNNITGNLRSFLMKIDSVGNVEWRRVYNSYYTFFDIEVAADSGYFVPSGFNGTNALQLVKFNKNGIYEWKVGVTTNNMAGYPIEATLDGPNYAIVAFNYLYDVSSYSSAVSVSKVDLNTKSILWEKVYYTYKSFDCISLHQAMGVETLPNGDIIVSGTANRYGHDAVILKLNSNGDSLWCKSYDFEPDTWSCQLNDLIVTDDGGFMGVGFFSDQNSGWTAWMFKTDANGTIGWDTSTPLSTPEVKVYPNPASEFVNIEFANKLSQDAELKIYNSLGQLVLRNKIIKGKQTCRLDIAHFNSGVYFFEIVSNTVVLGSGKFLVE